MSDSEVILWGGYKNNNYISEEDLIFNLYTNTINVKDNVDYIYKPATVFNYNNKKYYLFGGFADGIFNNYLWKFSPQENIWEKIDINNAPESREGGKLVYSEVDNSIYLYGGRSSYGVYNDFWKLNLNTNEWENLETTSPPYYNENSYLFYRDGKIYLFEGGNDKNTMGLYFYDSLNNSWVKKVYSSLENFPSSRVDYSLIYSPDNDYLFLFGGINTNGEKLNDLWVLDINTMEWKNYYIGIIKPKERSKAEFIYDYEYHSVYLFGGIDSDGIFNDDVWSLEIGASNWKMIKENSSYYSFADRSGYVVFWINTNNGGYIYVLGGKGDNNYFYLPDRAYISCEE
jgi:N-acetylneuraminic acid mutarotase